MHQDDRVARTPADLHRRAVALSIEGKYTLAQATLDKAAASTTDADLQARITGTRAFVLQRTGRPDEAEKLCRDTLASRGLSDHTTAILMGQLGAIAMYSGRLDEAHQWLSQAIGRLDGDPAAAARVRVNRSLASSQRGRLQDAAADLEIAVAVFDEAGLKTDAAHARHNLGYFALLEGDLVGALQLMQRARPIAAATPIGAATCDVDRAEVLRDAGLTTDAEAILARTASVFGAHRMPQSRAEAEFSLARSKLMHDPAAAARIAAAATRRFRTLGNETWAVRADAVRLRARLAGHGRTPTAEEVEATASDLSRRGFVSEAAALRMSLELWRARHGAQGGRIVRAPRTASMDVQLLAHEVRAARAAAAGRGADVRRHVAAGLDTLARWQSTFGSLDLQTSIVMHGNALMLAGLTEAVRSGRPDVMFEWSERARHLSQQVVPLRPPPEPSVAAELAELRMLRADDPSGAWLSDPRAADLRDRARERQWMGTGTASFQGHVTLDGLLPALGGDAALITYVYTGEAMAALVVTAENVTAIDIDSWPTVQRAMPGLRADLDMSASIRSGPMAGVIRRSLDDRLAELSAALLDRAVQLAGDRRLVITLPGVMGGIPWAMLPGMRGRVFTLATSATKWANGRGPDAAPQRAGFAVGPRVIRGEEEVDAAASVWARSTVLRGIEATVAAVTDLAARVDVLHLATHGKHAVDNPLFSGLELADGALFGYDIDLMPQVPATVVLSACEVGRSSVRWGEEAIGMTRIWLHAGTRCVIAAPVVVADDEACELLGAIHEGLVAGQMPAEALCAASERTGIVAPFQAHGAGF